MTKCASPLSSDAPAEIIGEWIEKSELQSEVPLTWTSRDLMSEESEFKRYVREKVSDCTIVAALREKYGILRSKKTTMFDAYFGLTGFSEESSLRLREEGGNLEVTLKICSFVTPEGKFERNEFDKPEDVCQRLGIAWQGDLKHLISELRCRYGLNFIARQKRTRTLVEDMEISLDTVYYHCATQRNIPPVSNAIGKIFHFARIYEAEIKHESTEIANSITTYLCNLGLLGDVCKTKEQIGREAFFKSQLGTSRDPSQRP